jgi:hypothetical protein
MKTKIKLLIGASFFFIVGSSLAQTWSHGSDALRTGIPSGGLGGASAANGSLLFYNSGNTNTVTIQSGTTATSYSMTLPTAQATSGDVLQNNGSGILSWTSVSAITNIHEASLTLSSAQVLALYSANGYTGYEIVPAPTGTGQYIEVISASAVLQTFGGTRYSDPVPGIGLIHIDSDPSTCGFSATQSNALLRSTVANVRQFTVGPDNGCGSYTDVQIVPNRALQVQALYANPTGGNSGIIIKVLYRIVTI